MIALEKARQHLETLGLKQAVEVLDNTLDSASSRQLTYPEMLADLLEAEVTGRRERYLSPLACDGPWRGLLKLDLNAVCAVQATQ